MHDGTVSRAFYGLHDLDTEEVVDWFLTEQEAEAALRDVLRDEPGWVGRVEVVEIDFNALAGLSAIRAD